MIKTAIKKLSLPSLLTFKNGKPVKTKEAFERRREELKDILQKEVYGILPPKPAHLRVDLTAEETLYLAGFATYRELCFHCEIDGEDATFPVTQIMPKGEGRFPVFVCVNFGTDVVHKYLPLEEIIQRGYGIFVIKYQDVAKDSADFRSGMAKHLCKSRRALSAPGKIAMWAWAAMRVMDYIPLCENVDAEQVAVIGHSRLGKTALFCGAMDERFRYVISNDSGCTGAALSRQKEGESIAQITERFPYWFCPRYLRYAGKEDLMPFDQHFLLSLIAPRHLLIGSAEGDRWAGPENEFLATAAANEAYALYGMQGLVHQNEFPAPDTELDEGDCLYHYRRGTHYLSRRDWNAYMDFIDKKRVK